MSVVLHCDLCGCSAVMHQKCQCAVLQLGVRSNQCDKYQMAGGVITFFKQIHVMSQKEGCQPISM